MHRFLGCLLITPLLMSMIICTPIERTAYDTVVSAKAFIGEEKKLHPECASGMTPPSTVCIDLVKATSAKDLLIDAAEVYCSSPQFDSGGACQPPAKGTPARTQAEAKLKAAIAGYNQMAADLKGVL